MGRASSASARSSTGRVLNRYSSRGDSPIDLSTIAANSVCSACTALKSGLPTFAWTTGETFTKYSLSFAAPSKGMNKPFFTKTLKGASVSYLPAEGVWKKVLTMSHNNGSNQAVYWKITGTMADKTMAVSEIRMLRVAMPEPPTLTAPVEGAVLPISTPPKFVFDTRCNVKFTVQISTLADFSKAARIRSFTYMVKDPNTETALTKTLTAGQWKAVQKLLGSATGYYRIKAWDKMNRSTISEVRSFTTSL
jgi:hypothetical protein